MANTSIKKVAILFAGGPAPAANAVISCCAESFLRNGVEVVGIKHGYSSLIDYDGSASLEIGEAYIPLTRKVLRRTRNRGGIIIGTARSNPGKFITSPDDFKDAEKSAPLNRVYEGLRSLGVDALVSIGGDDTLKTANKFRLFQDHLPASAQKIPVVHVPKTIDNDYSGIDFTFGFFTAVEVLAGEIRNLIADAEAGRSYFMCETMGRSAGWLAYGASIAGEASLVLSVEDIEGELLDEKSTPNRRIMNVQAVVEKLVKTIRHREEEEGKRFGVIVLAEGLAEYFDDSYLQDVPRDDHGHISVAHVDLGKRFAKMAAAEYEKQTGKKKKITGLQLGYESRCARPQAFDVMLGSQLGVGAYRALIEEELNGVMVSVVGQLDLRYVPFDELVDPDNLVTKVRFIVPGSDFHRLARFLETDIPD